MIEEQCEQTLFEIVRTLLANSERIDAKIIEGINTIRDRLLVLGIFERLLNKQENEGGWYDANFANGTKIYIDALTTYRNDLEKEKMKEFIAKCNSQTKTIAK